MTTKEAIKLLRRMQEPEAYEPQINEAAFNALDMAIKALEQPEIIRCGDCKYSEEDEDEHGIVDRWCRIWAETCTDDGYCNYAKRRIDG